MYRKMGNLARRVGTYFPTVGNGPPNRGNTYKNGSQEHPAHCFVRQHRLAIQLQETQMLAHQKLRAAQRSVGRVAYLNLSIVVAWVFLDAIDGPVNFGGAAATAVYKV